MRTQLPRLRDKAMKALAAALTERQLDASFRDYCNSIVDNRDNSVRVDDCVTTAGAPHSG